MSHHPRAGDGSIIGMARLARRLSSGEDINPLWTELGLHVAHHMDDANTVFDMSMILRLMGDVAKANTFQERALALQSSFICRHGSGRGLKVLVLVTSVDVMANTPVDFLVEDCDFEVRYLHVDKADMTDLPPHDVAFLAIGESIANRPILEKFAPLLQSWPRPVMNAYPDNILRMTRDGVCALFDDQAFVLSPKNVRISRVGVQALIEGGGEANGFLTQQIAYPLLIRPFDTHCGKGLEKVDDDAQLSEYLERFPDEGFYISPFVDYSGSDGLFRKQRITFVDGKPYAAHMAVSEHWLVHYVKAGMLESAAKRREEAVWMQTFDTDFVVKHAQALSLIAEKIGVDYFSIDCAETKDGRLLLFEADVSSIVHTLDSEEIFPYKRPIMAKLFAGFQAALEKRAIRPALAQAAA